MGGGRSGREQGYGVIAEQDAASPAVSRPSRTCACRPAIGGPRSFAGQCTVPLTLADRFPFSLTTWTVMVVAVGMTVVGSPSPRVAEKVV